MCPVKGEAETVKSLGAIGQLACHKQQSITKETISNMVESEDKDPKLSSSSTPTPWHACAHTHTRECAHMHTCVCAYLSVCVHTFIHTHKQYAQEMKGWLGSLMVRDCLAKRRDGGAAWKKEH